MPQRYNGEKASLPMMGTISATKARYKKRTTHRTSRRKTRLDYSKFSDRYMAPPWGIPDGNGHYRVVPPN